MRVRIGKWGRSLAVQIPTEIAVAIGLTDGSEIDLSVTGGRLVIMPVAIPDQNLAELLERVTEGNKHGEFGTGPRRGKEDW